MSYVLGQRLNDDVMGIIAFKKMKLEYNKKINSLKDDYLTKETLLSNLLVKRDIYIDEKDIEIEARNDELEYQEEQMDEMDKELVYEKENTRVAEQDLNYALDLLRQIRECCMDEDTSRDEILSIASDL
tara:strand:- start:6038 stop:6424 length:387 start_codon:yes stop_codon:yes gene_type:complete